MKYEVVLIVGDGATLDSIIGHENLAVSKIVPLVESWTTIKRKGDNPLRKKVLSPMVEKKIPPIVGHQVHVDDLHGTRALIVEHLTSGPYKRNVLEEVFENEGFSVNSISPTMTRLVRLGIVEYGKEFGYRVVPGRLVGI